MANKAKLAVVWGSGADVLTDLQRQEVETQVLDGKLPAGWAYDKDTGELHLAGRIMGRVESATNRAKDSNPTE